MKGILVRKIGMKQYISPENGDIVPITILEAPKNVVLQVKTSQKEGYDSFVLGAFERKNFGKNENKKYLFIKEIPCCEGESFQKGDSFGIEVLRDVKNVKITGTSKGRGFSGVIKRYNFHRGPETHGSTHHREPGSSGTCAKPGRVVRGKKFPGQYGNVRVTVRSTQVVDIDTEKNLIAVKGAVPGSKNSFVTLLEA